MGRIIFLRWVKVNRSWGFGAGKPGLGYAFRVQPSGCRVPTPTSQSLKPRSLSMMFKFDGVDQSGSGNSEAGLLVIFLDRDLRTGVCPDEFLDAGVQTRVFNQALIFRIRELLYCFQFGYGIRAKYQPEFFRPLFRIEFNPAPLWNFDPLILRQMR